MDSVARCSRRLANMGLVLVVLCSGIVVVAAATMPGDTDKSSLVASQGQSLLESQLQLLRFNGSAGHQGVGTRVAGALSRPPRQATNSTSPKKKWKKKAKKKHQSTRGCLKAHNKYRRLHNVPELKWDRKLEAFAQKRSNHIAASDGKEFGHPPNLPYGENLFWHSSARTSCAYMVKGWYDEIELYNYKSPSFASATGHFTQVVWRRTRRVGCAMAKSTGRRGGVYLTCNYDPPGNWIGEFEKNVPPPARPFTSLAAPTDGDDEEEDDEGDDADEGQPERPTAPATPSSTTTTTTTTVRPATLSTSVAPSSTTTTNTANSSTAKPKKKKNKKKKKKKGKKKKPEANASAPVSTNATITSNNSNNSGLISG